jgi:GNAT superfamily N-acetyltransferase
MRAAGDLEIRRATPRDAALLAALVVEGFESYREFARPGWVVPTFEQESLQLATTLARPSAWCALACDASGLAGHVGWLAAAEARRPVADPGLGHLWQLFVRRDRWGTGLAARLHSIGLEAAAEHGFTALRLYTPADHARARRFYEREGWTLRGEPFDDAAFGMAIAEYRREL